MKKLLSLFLLVLIIFTVTACNASPNVSAVLGVDLSDAVLEDSIDERGWFGDGVTFLSYTFPDDDEAFEAQIQASESWLTLPLSDNINTLVYGNSNSTPYITDEDGNSLFPTVENGYYLFIDRHSDSENANDDSDLFDRDSYNVTVAIYDSDTNILYYCESDT